MTAPADPSPELVTVLATIAARLDRIEARLASVPEDGVLRRAVATAVDSFDHLAARPDADERARAVMRVAERLTDPTFVDRLERLEHAAAQVPGLVATAVDTVDGWQAGERFEAAARLVDRLSDPRTVAQVGQLLDLSAQVPGLVATAVDTVDGWQAGERFEAAAQLAARLSDPRTVARLDRLLDLTEQAPGLVATLIDSLDAIAGQPGFDADARLRTLTRLLDLASQPGTAALVDQLHQHADTLPVLLRMVTTTMDVAADTVLASRVPLAERVRTGFLILERATEPDTARRLVHALDGLAVLDDLLVSGALDAGAVRVVGHAATALRETAASAPEPAGLFGLLGALGDRSVRRALGFFLDVLRRLGARLGRAGE